MRVQSATVLMAASTLAVLLAPLGAAASPAKPVLLRYHFSAGQKTPYTLQLGLTGAIPVLAPKLNLSEQVPFTQLVTTVYKDGSAQVSYSFSSASTTLNGQTTSSALAASSIDKISATGQVTNIKSLGLSGQFGGVMNVDPTVGLPQFPVRPVAVGATWSAKQTINLGSFGVLSGPLHYVLAGLTTAGNKHTIAAINASGVLPLTMAGSTMQATGNASGTEAISFDVTSGAVLNVTAHLKIAANIGARGSDQGSSSVTQPIKLDMQFKLTNQPAGAAGQN